MHSGARAIIPRGHTTTGTPTRRFFATASCAGMMKGIANTKVMETVDIGEATRAMASEGY
jgi:hypothetical protein